MAVSRRPEFAGKVGFAGIDQRNPLRPGLAQVQSWGYAFPNLKTMEGSP